MTYKSYFFILAILLSLTACATAHSNDIGATAHSNDIVAEGENPVKVADSYSFTEGPAADAKGDVYFTDQPNNRKRA